MGGLSIWHWLIVGVIVMLLFGKGRFSDMMGDVAKGLKSFKKGMSEEDEPVAPPPAKPAVRLQQQAPLEPNSDATLQPMKDDRPHS
jgi:sec-independent protein translocase protein TatA